MSRQTWLAIALAVVTGAVVLVWVATRGAPGGRGGGASQDAGGVGAAIRVPDRPSLDRVGVRGAGPERLTGTVVDASGAPVGDVTITATLELGPGEHSQAPGGVAPPPPVVAYAGPDGAFALDGLEPGRHRLRVEGAGIFPAELPAVAVPSDAVRIAVARRVDVVGIVVDGDRTVPGAVVTIDGEALGGRLETVADAAGAFAFDALPEGSYRVWAHQGDLAARAVRAPRLGAGPWEPVTLTLEPATIVVGRVVDRATGIAVAAAVSLEPLDATGAEAARFARTGADGVFRIEGVPHGRWLVDAYAPGWRSTGALELEAGRVVPEVELVAGAILEGRVVDARGAPVVGATIRATGDAPDGRTREASADVDVDQLRRFSGFAPIGRAGAPAAPAPRAPGGVLDFTSDPRFIPRGELGVLLGPLPYPPPPGASVARQTTIVAAPAAGGDAGVTVPGASGAPAPLAADPAFAAQYVTDDRGRFRITGLDAATWTVIATAPGMAPGRSRAARVDLGKAITDLEIVLGPGTFLAGVVRSTDGTPLVGATVTAAPAGARGGADPVVAVTDAAGAYRMGPLVGDVVVTASMWGHADGRAELALPPPAGDRAAEISHAFALAPADATLRGRVLDPDRLPVRDADVIVAGGAARGRRARTDDDGWFEIPRVAAGDAAVEIEHPEFPRQRFSIDTGADASLSLAWGGALEARVTDRHTGAALPGIAVILAGAGSRRELASGAGGELRSGPVVAGTYTLRVRVPGYVAFEEVVEIPAGDEAGEVTARDVRIELERGALVAGVVRDRYGSRLAGARVVIARGTTTVEARTDADGAFRLRDVPTGEVFVRAERDELRGATRLTLRPGDEVLTVQLTVE